MTINVTIQSLISQNYYLNDGNCRIINEHSLQSCLSSYHYYDSIQLQICSIFRSIILNHCFEDGNKRTAVSFLFLECNYQNLEINISDEQLRKLVYYIIEHKPKVEYISNNIFKNM